MDEADRLLSLVETGLATASAASILIMMCITAVDVLMRYAFNAPLKWAFDLITQYLLVAAFFLVFSFALRRGDHVAVDYFVPKFPPRLQRIALGLALLASCALFATISVLASLDTIAAWEHNEVVAGEIPWPIWAAKAIIPLSVAPLTCRLFLMAVGQLLTPVASESDGSSPNGQIIEGSRGAQA